MKKNSHSYLGYFRPYIRKLLLALILSAVSTAGGIWATDLFSTFVQMLSVSAPLLNVAPPILCWGLVSLASKAFSRRSSIDTLKIKSKSIRDIRWSLYRHLSQASSESVAKNDSISLVEITCSDVELFLDALHNIYAEVLSILLGVWAFAYTAMHSWQLTILLIITFMVVFTNLFFAMKKMLSSQQEARERSIATKNLLVSIIEGFEDIKVQQLTQGLKPILAEAVEKELRSNEKAQKILINNSFVSDSIGIISQISFFIVAAALITTGELSYATFLSIYLYRNYVYGLASAALKLAKFKAQLDNTVTRMDKILLDESIFPQKWGRTHIHKHNIPFIANQDLILDNLSAGYIDNPDVVSDVSVVLPATSLIGIVGPSGSGKSTLLRAIARLAKWSSGGIFLGDLNISDLDERSFTRIFTMIPQFSVLFPNYTVAENLRLANPDATDEELLNALKSCNALEFVLEKGGLNAHFKLNELSGGQRQRIAIARMLLCNSKVLLMDESTSALDGASQKAITDTVKRLVEGGRTVVMVAHRVNTLKNANLIIYMKDGKVEATGTYAQLYETYPDFRNLADLG